MACQPAAGWLKGRARSNRPPIGPPALPASCSPRLIDLNNVMLNLDTMLRRLIGEDIEVLTVPAVDLGTVKADPGQIEQVLMNLALNARDAMPNGGKLTLETSNIQLDDAYAREHQPVEL